MKLVSREKQKISFYVIVLVLTFIALTAEILPEVSAKMIVVPTLIFTIVLISSEILGKIKSR